MIRVKICGLQDAGTALAAAQAGADYIGLVLAPSRRRVSPQKARDISQAIHAQTPGILIVGVVVDLPPEEAAELAKTCQLDMLQLSGNETWESCARINYPLIKALHVSNSDCRQDLIREIEAGREAMGNKVIFLLDTHVRDSFGGTGRVFDWELARGLSSAYPIMIGGGLTPQNVGQLVAGFNPGGVDVSSGVETGGQKDIQKIIEFLKNARLAEGRETACWL
jgi:phosphoribosylanthranilate isomerase